MSLPKFKPWKSKGITGGGLLSSDPVQKSDSSFPLSDDEGEDFVEVNAVASTSKNTIDSSSGRSIRENSIDSNMIDEIGITAPKKRKPKSVPKSTTTATKKKKLSTKEPAFVSDIPWPKHFVELEKVFKVSSSHIQVQKSTSIEYYFLLTFIFV